MFIFVIKVSYPLKLKYMSKFKYRLIVLLSFEFQLFLNGKFSHVNESNKKVILKKQPTKGKRTFKKFMVFNTKKKPKTFLLSLILLLLCPCDFVFQVKKSIYYCHSI